MYNQLLILQQTKRVTSREVASISLLFPPSMKREWGLKYMSLTGDDQLEPFGSLYEFLQEQLKCAKLMSDTYLAAKSSPDGSSTSATRSVSSHQASVTSCILHPHSANHTTEICRTFVNANAEERRRILYEGGKCLRCLNDYHGKDQCSGPCKKCGMTNHHHMLCFQHENSTSAQKQGQGGKGKGRWHNKKRDAEKGGPEKVGPKPNIPKPTDDQTAPHTLKTVSFAASKAHAAGLYCIYSAKVLNRGRAVVFCDDGSDVSFISEAATRKLRATRLKTAYITMTTLSSSKRLKSALYEVTLVTANGRRVNIVAYSLPTLSGPISQLDKTVLSEIFPSYDAGQLLRPQGSVDILLGSDYFGLHPKTELTSDGANLSIMSGELGVCVQGSHPRLSEPSSKTDISGFHIEISSNMCDASPKVTSHPALDEPHATPTCKR